MFLEVWQNVTYVLSNTAPGHNKQIWCKERSSPPPHLEYGIVVLSADGYDGVDGDPDDDGEWHEPTEAISPRRVDVGTVASRRVVDPREYEHELYVHQTVTGVRSKWAIGRIRCAKNPDVRTLVGSVRETFRRYE